MKFNIHTRNIGLIEIDAEFIEIPGFTNFNWVLHKALMDDVILSDTLLSVSHFETGYTIGIDKYNDEASAKVGAQVILNQYKDKLAEIIATKEQVNFIQSPLVCRICEQPPLPDEVFFDGVCEFCSLPF